MDYMREILESTSPPATPGRSEPEETNFEEQEIELEGTSNRKRVEKILDHKKRAKETMMFKVKWLGYDWETHEKYEAIKEEKLKLFEYVREMKKTNPRRVRALLKNIPELEEALKV